MSTSLHQLIPLAENVGLVAVFLLAYMALRRKLAEQPKLLVLCVGVLFGFSAILSLMSPIQLLDGVLLEASSIIISLSTICAGPVSGLITVAMSATHRAFLGGVGAPASLVAMTAVYVLSVAFYLLVQRGRLQLSIRNFAALGTIIALIQIGRLAWLPEWAATLAAWQSALPAIIITMPAGMAVLGLILLREQQRMKLQADLGERSQLLSTIIDSMGDGVAVANKEGHIILTNPAATAMIGLQPTKDATAICIERYGLRTPEGKTPYPENEHPMVKALRGEATDQVEMLARNPAGAEDRVVSVSGRPLISADGEANGGVVVFRDITEQRHFDEQLRIAKERFELAVSGSQDGIWDYNPLTGQVWFSPRYKEILGYRDDEFPNDIQFWKGLMLPEDHAATTANFFDYEAGRVDRIEIVQRFRHKNGRIVHLHNRAQGLRHPDGKIERLVGAATDITPLIRAEQRLKDAISSLTDGFALFDAEDRLVVCNERFVEGGVQTLLGDPRGYTFEEIYRAFAYADDTLLPNDVERQAWLKARVERHRAANGEAYDFLGSDGRWTRIREYRTSEGGYVGTWTDITSVKQAEARLNEAIASINEGFALLDKDLRFVICNEKLLEMYPLSRHLRVPGARLEDVLRYDAEHGFHPEVSGRTREEIDAFVDRWMSRFRCDEPFLGEAQFADGRWILLSHSKTKDGDYVTVRTDITAQKRREEELTRTKEQLERQAKELKELAEELAQVSIASEAASKTKSRFLASMSHELRTPLTSILGFSDLIRSGVFGRIQPERYQEYVAMIHESGTHLLSLINDVLDLSKIEAGKMELSIETLSAQELLRQVVGLSVGLAKDRGVGLSAKVADGCSEIRADARAAKQIVINLLSNAIKFTPAGGEVKLEFRNGGDPTAKYQSEIIVRDTGIGMTPQEITKALQAYGQVESDLALKSTGTGLGLPLVKSLVELHRGNLVIDSIKGQGTTIRVQLP